MIRAFTFSGGDFICRQTGDRVAHADVVWALETAREQVNIAITHGEIEARSYWTALRDNANAVLGAHADHVRASGPIQSNHRGA